MNDWSDARAPHGGGAVDNVFSAVGDAFAENFADDLELGASFAAIVDGELVVDLRGGHTDKAGERPWTEETLTCVYSSGKAVLSLLIAHEVSEGRLDYDTPVSAWWPEFAQNGKEAITLGDVLSHQAGLCGVAEEMPPAEWLDTEAVSARLAAMAPLWKPGTANGYGPQTFGYIAGELLRRTTGRSVGALVGGLREKAGAELYCGIRDEALLARIAYMPKPPKAPDLGELNEFTKVAFLKPWSAPGRVSREAWLAAEIPASNIHANARGLASALYPFASGGRWQSGEAYLTPGAIEAALQVRITGDDLVLPFRLAWAAGLMRNINRHFGPSETAYGHAGFGGSCVIVDPQNRIAAAYVMNRMSPHLVGDPRSVRLLEALYGAL